MADFIINNGVLEKYTGEKDCIKVPEGITEIGLRAFQFSKSLRSVTVADGVTKIGRYAFFLCENLREVILPNGLTEVEREIFSFFSHF